MLGVGFKIVTILIIIKSYGTNSWSCLQ